MASMKNRFADEKRRPRQEGAGAGIETNVSQKDVRLKLCKPWFIRTKILGFPLPSNLDFVAPGFDFVAPALEFGATTLEFRPMDLEIISCRRSGNPDSLKSPRLRLIARAP
jgi:hypothetical protein